MLLAGNIGGTTVKFRIFKYGILEQIFLTSKTWIEMKKYILKKRDLFTDTKKAGSRRASSQAISLQSHFYPIVL